MQTDIQMVDAAPAVRLDNQLAATFSDSAGMTIGVVQSDGAVTLQAQGVKVADVIRIDYASAGWSVVDVLEPLRPGLYRCTRTWTNRTGSPLEVALLFELYRHAEPSSYLIPAINYNGNGWGNGTEPKGLGDTAPNGAGLADAPAWIFGGDRTSIPACTMTVADGVLVGLYTTPELANQSGCALRSIPGGIVQQVWWPLRESPRTYVRRDTYAPAIHATVRLEAGESCSREVAIAVHAAEGGAFDYRFVLDAAWEQYYRDLPAPYSPGQVWNLGLQFAQESLWVDTDQFTGFLLGRILQDGQWVAPTWVKYEIGWCGQNATLAGMHLQEYLWRHDEEAWRRGEKALNCWAERGRLRNGLFYTHFDDVLAGKTNPVLETCNLGGGAYSYFVAAELAEQAGRPRPLWQEMALGVCDFFVAQQLPDGRFGRYWRADGALIEADGTVGCWAVWPLIKAYQRTGEAAYLQAAQRGFRAYADDDLAHFCITAGALDTDCIDKEGAFPLLMAGLDLFQITGDAYYLTQAETAAYYLATWQWHYSLTYPAGSAAAQIGYDTFGGTSVSVQHHHLDPWGALIALGWLRLGQVEVGTGKRQWRERASAAWRQATRGVSDGTMAVDGVVRLAGGQDEGFLHTRWGKGPGGVSDWLVAWPSAFRLFTLQQWPDWESL